ncbi:hypothetical protein RF55_20010 [Lasius niger]|uniref:Uncharacterized protein n=1 Tax=Lasius niger TaxID=67767 RepID=A0A0J7JZF0_LASNI|nr:hypothetical protein RF55_20010 [Lasius niger]
MDKRKIRDGSSDPEDNENLRKRVRRLEKELIRKEKSNRTRHRSRKERCVRSTSRETRSGSDHSYRRYYDADRRSYSRDYYPAGRPYDSDSLDGYDGKGRNTRNHSPASNFIEIASEKAPFEQSAEVTGDQGTVEGEETLDKSDNVPEEEEEELPAEIVEMFGDRIMPDRVLAPAVHKDLAVRWEDIIKKGLPSEERKKSA